MSQEVRDRISAAAERILDGSPERSQGKATVTDLAVEAGLSRATVNKLEYRDLVVDFRARAAQAPTAPTAPVDSWESRCARAEASLTRHKKSTSETVAELRSQLKNMAATIQLQAVLIEHLREGGVEPTPLWRPEGEPR